MNSASAPKSATPTSFAVEEATIEGIHQAMKAGKLTAHQLVQTYLDRIAAYDKQGPALNAIITINSEALRQADELDRKFKTSGPVGPLHGIPILIKDAIATDDMPTTGGSLSLKGFTPPKDAVIVDRLKRAGAIILGKSNLDEFTFGTRGLSSLGGQTLNPYDLTRSPAGSSGGAAAAVAANMAVAAIGTDTGSSIRYPASATGLVGVRATVGLISRTGIMPNSYTQDTGGPLTRTVEDAARILDVIAGYDTQDPVTAWGVGKIPSSYIPSRLHRDLKGVRIGVLRSFFGTSPDAADVNAVVEAATKSMQALGGTVTVLDEPFDIKELNAMQPALYETTHYLDQYLQSVKAPYASLEQILASGKYAKAIEESIKSRVSLSMNDPGYKERLLRRLDLQQRVMTVMADHSVDVLIYPFNRAVVSQVGAPQSMHNGFLGAITGFPSIIVPAGFTPPTTTASIGLPVGIEILGRPWDEMKLLSIAQAYEQATKHRQAPPTTPRLH